MIPIRVGLISLSKDLKESKLTRTAAALQEQASIHLGPTWNIEATVEFFSDLDGLPFGYWPIIIMDGLDDSQGSGFHTVNNHLPYSIVRSDNDWQLTCSHELCEMLVNPFFNKLATADSPEAHPEKVQFLVEVCDPCGDSSYVSSINGINLSDFCTPNFYDDEKVHGVKYSYTGAIEAPRQILQNGSISWHNPRKQKWYLQDFNGANKVISRFSISKSFGLNLPSRKRLSINPFLK
jgi:hypothetical protein